MLFYIFLVFLCSNFWFIKSEDNGTITIKVTEAETCIVQLPSYTFTEGYNVTIVIQSTYTINHGWGQLISSSGSKTLFQSLVQDYTAKVDKSMEGIWQFKFLHNKDTPNLNQNSPKTKYGNSTYTSSLCKTNVTIVSEPNAVESGGNGKYIAIVSTLAVVASVIILAQTAYILFLKAKASRLNAHKNLSKKTEPSIYMNDSARYCSNPGQKMMKIAAPVDDKDRDSVIYEAPNIELSGRLPMQPPQPPALSTMPRTPRPDHNNRVCPQGMLASALNSPARSPAIDSNPPTFPRPKQIERDMNVANRPPLPLPPQDHRFEVYEEMDTEDNTYEPPPIINTVPPRHPVPSKKVPTANLLDVKQDTLKLRGINKPPVTPKPQRPRSNNFPPANELEQALRRRNNDTLPKANELENALRRRNNDAKPSELEEALRRRNNVKQVPIVSIPDPASPRRSPKPKPPVAKSKPRVPPVSQPVQEEIYYNQNQESSDEEWTYEPLKPLNSYDPNIYNV